MAPDKRLDGKPSKAGASAHQNYREMRKAWLRRKRRYFALFGLAWWAFFVVSQIIGIIYYAYRPHWSVIWGAGLIAGAMIMGWLILRDSPPSSIANWQTGAWGEERTAKELAKLPKEWTVLHDIDTGRGNIDHLVVGPAGVFVLDTKNWSGTVEVSGSVAFITPWGAKRPNRWDGSSAVLSLARQTSDRIASVSRIRQWVNAGVVIWSEFPERISGERTPFIAGDHLVEWLTSQPTRLQPEHVERVTAAVRGAWATPRTS
ncbi:nuclease-related domain-containing protein [Aestuariimicrobium ganziense]|uniref:nuclease-related domain-containing protein n=1 Tax=Aestuariimicrobium ganziense TaxID=2773677 RepID=UPI001945A17E|nr:nuclease-related domain-containing protein [Aestuariimicrobium ganziense]